MSKSTLVGWPASYLRKWFSAHTSSGKVLLSLLFLCCFITPKLNAQSIDGTDFSQSSNENPTLGNVVWINSILQQNNSRYAEGMSTLQRTFLMGIPVDPSGHYKLLLSHQATKGNIHAYDFIVNWPTAITTSNAIIANAYVNINKCGNLGPKVTTADCDALSADNAALNIVAAAPTAASYGTVAGDNVTTRVAAFDGANGGATASRGVILRSDRPVSQFSNVKLVFLNYSNDGGDAYANYELQWDGPTSGDPYDLLVMLGGHLAVGGDGTGIGYGAGKGSSAINGGPYHFKLDKLILGASNEISLGAQDNQIKGADIIIPPPPCTISPSLITLCEGSSAPIVYTGPANMDSYTWTISPAGPTLSGANTQTLTVTNAAPGTYTIKLVTVDQGVTSEGNCTATLTINALPASQTLTGGNYCEGSAQSHINMAGSQSGVNYQLQKQNGIAWDNVGTAVAGTGAAIDFGAQAPGTYRVVATNATTECSRTFGSAVISENPRPASQTLTGGNYCEGSAQSHINMAGSQSGVNYQLQKQNGIAWDNVGTAVAGTGAAIDFGAQAPGTYRVVATNATTECSRTFGSAVISENPRPASQTLTGGNYCEGSAQSHINMAGSQSGVNYQLQKQNGIAWDNVGTAVAGTGAAIDFGAQAPGTYRVVATNATTECSRTFGSAVISENPRPASQTLTGGNYCEGSAQSHINMAGSQSGVNYQLQKQNGIAWDNVGTAVAGTGAAIDFGAQAPGTYRVVATNATTECSRTFGSAVISENPRPASQTLTGGNYCEGSAQSHINMAGSQSGVNYQLQKQNGIAWDNVGTAVAGTGAAIDFGAQAPGTYRVVATNATTECSRTFGSAVISENPRPASQTLTGGNYCEGSAQSHINMAGSQSGVNYQLQKQNGIAWDNVGTAVAGTGAAIDFGAQAPGTYRVVATNATTECSRTFGSAVISENPRPASQTLTGGNYCEGSAQSHINMAGSQSGVNYQLQKQNGIAWDNVGTAVAGTGAAIDFGAQAPGTYRVVATNATTECSRTFGSAVISENPRPASQTLTGGNYCEGSAQSHINMAGSQSGVNYQLQKQNGIAWDNVGTAVAGTGAAIDFGAQAPGTYRVVATNATTECSRTFGSAVISENPRPTVTGTLEVCSGSTTQLSGSPEPAAVNPWVSSNTSVATVSNTGLVTGVAAGTANITYTNSLGCQRTVTVTVNACNVPVCTYTQGFYGNVGGLACQEDNTTPKLPALTMMQNAIGVGGHYNFGQVAGLNNYFSLVYADVNDGANSNIFKMLPGGGSSQAIGGIASYANTGTWNLVKLETKAGNNYGKIKNTLLAQTMSMYFNLHTSPSLGAVPLTEDTLLVAKRDCATGDISSTSVKYGLPHSVVEYLKGTGQNTVQGLFNLADKALGGALGLPNKDSIAKAVDVLNNAFDGCAQLTGYIAYVPVQSITSSSARMITGISEAQETSVLAVNVKAYPNPYNDRVQFNIESSVSGKGSLVVYNLLGQKVKTVYEGYIFAGKGHVVEFRVPALSRTSLIYVFTINGKQRTGKLINQR